MSHVLRAGIELERCCVVPILTQTLGQRLQQLVLCSVMVAILGEIKGPRPQDPISDRAYSQNSQRNPY